MPPKVLDRRSQVRPDRIPHELAMQAVVLAAIVEILVDAPAHLDVVIGGDRQVSPIEESVEIAAQQQPVVDSMLALGRIGANMGGFENR